MALTPNKAEYYRFNGTAWDLFYFKTSADLIVETESYKVLTATERANLTNFLTPANFNKAGNLLQLGANGADGQAKIPTNHIPDLSSYYLALAGGTVTGATTFNADLTVGTAKKLKTPTLDVSVINATGTGGVAQFNGILEMNQNRISEVADPTSLQDAATKSYVDSVAAMGTHPVEPVAVAATGDLALTGVGMNIDAFQVSAGMRVLAWKQEDPKQNGIYIVATGAWEKVTADSGQGAYVFVSNGQTHNDWYFFCKTVGTDGAAEWIEAGRPDTVTAAANGGLRRAGNAMSIKDGGVTNDMLAGSIEWSKLIEYSGGLPYVNNGWTSLPYQSLAGSSNSVENILSAFENAIRLLRGTASFSTNNNETIAGAYTKIGNIEDTMISTQTTTAVPSATTGYNTGDLMFRILA